MQKKKIAKRAKMKKSPAKSRTTQQGVLSLAEKVEKEFHQIPMKLAKLYRQELMTLKQQETKLKDDLKKTQVLQKFTQKKQTELLKAKKTASGQKQLAAVKQTLSQAAKTTKDFARKLDQLAKNSVTLLAKKIKYTTLSKELSKLEKQLTMKANQPAKAQIQKKAPKKTAKPIKPDTIQTTDAIDKIAKETSAMTSQTIEALEMESSFTSEIS